MTHEETGTTGDGQDGKEDHIMDLNENGEFAAEEEKTLLEDMHRTVMGVRHQNINFPLVQPTNPCPVTLRHDENQVDNSDKKTADTDNAVDTAIDQTSPSLMQGGRPTDEITNKTLEDTIPQH